ncbi:MAG: hypothetical protein OXF02_06410 [Simkaniaceae bacterium]|nr:hypothetical protein [Simkaniaceae bacterium]
MTTPDIKKIGGDSFLPTQYILPEDEAWRVIMVRQYLNNILIFLNVLGEKLNEVIDEVNKLKGGKI